MMDEEQAKARVPRIDLSAAADLFNRGVDVLFVDVRPQEAYEESHIPGALSMPLAELPTTYRNLPRDRELVLY